MVYAHTSQSWEDEWRTCVFTLELTASAHLDIHSSAIIVLGSELYDCVGNINVRADTKDSATEETNKMMKG